MTKRVAVAAGLATLASVAGLTIGCGVTSEDQPQPIEQTSHPATPATPSVDSTQPSAPTTTSTRATTSTTSTTTRPTQPKPSGR